MFFHALTLAWSHGGCLNRRWLGRVLKHPQRDPGNVNAMKRTFANIILAFYLILPKKSCTKNAAYFLPHCIPMSHNTNISGLIPKAHEPHDLK